MKTIAKNLCSGVRNMGLWGLMLMAALPTLGGCHSVDDERTPPAGVWIVFASEPVWTKYGTPGALDHKRFILPENIPADFPYTASMQTGYGGVLLVGDINGNPAAYDLSCPVENSATVRIVVDEEHNDAYCPKCGSRYSIYSNYGQPVSGPAADKSHPYGLRKYAITAGPLGEYRVIRP